MSLPNPFTKNTNQTSFLFIAILITDRHLQSALVEISSGKIQVRETSSLLAYKNDEDGVVQADKSLQDLGPGSENISQVVFGFDPRWIGSSGLVDSKKPFLKKFTESLSLEPIGYVLLTEAFVFDLMAESPLASSVCIFVQTGELYLFLLKQGRLADKVVVGRSNDVVADLSEGLARLSKTVKKENQYFPARITLMSSEFDRALIEDVQQKIIAHDWTADYPFLQAPVIDLIPAEALMNSVISQGGKAVANNMGLKLEQNPQLGSADQSASESNQGLLSDESGDGVMNPEDFGYKEVGVDSQLDRKDEQHPNQEQVINQLKDENNLENGLAQKQLVINDNLSEANQTPEEVAMSFGVPIGSSKLPKINQYSDSEDSATTDDKSQLSNDFLPSSKKKFSLKNLSPKQMVLIGVLIGIISLAFIALASMFFVAKASFDIELKTITIAKEAKITLDPQAKESDPKNLILSASLVDKEITDSDQYKTTGVKLVGEKASGKVTIFNKTESLKTFEAGTVLTFNDQKFTLDEEIRVASSTVELKSTGETKVYGQAEAKITASEIGADGNIGKDSDLKIASFDSNTYSAKTIGDLSGGSSREIRVVAEKDRVTLLADLTKTLADEAKDQFAQESGNGRYLVPIGMPKQEKIVFSAEVGDEVDDIKLTLTIVSQAISYSSDDLKPLAKEVLQDELPANYQLLDENPEIMTAPSSDTATQSAKTVLEANISAKAQPIVDISELKQQIQGRSFVQIKTEFESKDEIKSVSHQLWPSFASAIVKNAPKNLEKIEVSLK